MCDKLRGYSNDYGNDRKNGIRWKVQVHFRSLYQRISCLRPHITVVLRESQKMKKVHIITILVLVTIVPVLVMKNCRHKKVLEEYSPPLTANVAIEERLDKQVSALKLQSITETVQQLDKMEYYRYPGKAIGAGTIFLQDNEGNIVAESSYKNDSIELERVLSSRAFRKSLQDLSQLPGDQASELLASEIDVALSRYLELYDERIRVPSTLFEAGESSDGQPVLLGLRYKLFALVLIAGSLELTGMREKIKEIDGIAKGQRAQVNLIEDAQIRSSYSLSALLHNNLVLATGLYGTSQQKGDAKLKPFVTRFVDHKLVDFSARGTEYDVLVQYGVQELVPDKEHINVRYFDYMTNEDLDELRRILDAQ